MNPIRPIWVAIVLCAAILCVVSVGIVSAATYGSDATCAVFRDLGEDAVYKLAWASPGSSIDPRAIDYVLVTDTQIIGPEWSCDRAEPWQCWTEGVPFAMTTVVTPTAGGAFYGDETGRFVRLRECDQ